MISTGFSQSKGKKWPVIALISILVVLAAAVLPAASLTVYEFKIKEKEIEYGEKLEISIIFVGDGALRIKNTAGETITLFTLKKGGEYTYQIDSEGLLYPGDYYAQVLDENGNEVANESFKVTSTSTIVVVTFGEEKKAQSYLYDILIVPTTLKVGNNTLDVFFSSNTYSKGGAKVYLEVPEGWKTEKVKLGEINFKNHVQLPVEVPSTAYGSYILTLHVDTTFGKFNKSFAVTAEGTAPATTPTPAPTPTPTSTPMPTATPILTPSPTPTPTQTPAATATPTTPTTPTTTNETGIGNKTVSPTPEPVASPGFEVLLAVLAFLAVLGLRPRMR